MKDSIIDKVVKYLQENRLSIRDGSGIIKEFEDHFAQYHNRRFALATNNGTSALFSAYHAIGLQPGEEVLAPAIAWHSAITPLLQLKARPVFVDIDRHTLNYDASLLEKKITKKTKAIYVVHFGGIPCDMDRICSLAKKHMLKIIEDCSHAFGAKWDNRLVGTFGDISCFSLQAGKPISGGEAGILLTDNKRYFDDALLLGHFGRLGTVNSPYKDTGLGFKFRPHPLALVIALENLKNVDLSGYIDNYVDLNRKLSQIKEIKTRFIDPRIELHGLYGYRFCSDMRGLPAQTEDYPYLPGCRIFHAEDDCPVAKEMVKKTYVLQLAERFNPQENDKTVRMLQRHMLRKEGIVFADSRCNCNCKPCIYSNNKHDVIDQIDNLESGKMILKGIEPLIRKDIVSIIKYAKSRGVKKIIAFTNGRILKYKTTVKRFADIGIDAYHIYHYSRGCHDNITQVPGSFIDTMKGIENLKNLHIPYELEKLPSSCGLNVEWESTMRCNKSCFMCYQGRHFASKDELTVSDVRQMLEKNNVENMTISGGEFFVRKDALKILQLMKEFEVNVRIISNGSLTPPLDYGSIVFSLDGLKTAHDRIRGSGSFDQLMKCIKVQKCPVSIATVLFEDNLDEVRRVVDFALLNGYSPVVLPNEVLSDKEIDETVDFLKEWDVDRSMIHTQGMHDKKAINVSGIERFIRSRHLHKKEGRYVCSNLVNPTIRIDQDGNVVGCRLIRKIFGDVRRNTFQEIWDSPDYTAYRKKQLRRSLPICYTCPKSQLLTSK